MDSLGGQPVTQTTVQPTVWYNYSTWGDLVNHPMQVQVAVPTVQMVAAPSQTPSPAPAAVQTPVQEQISVMVDIGQTKTAKKTKKPPPENQERNFHCEQCGSSFTNSSNLRSHMRIHSGVRPYVCVVCGKSFIQSSNLKAHKRVHTGERPYQCSECGQTFSRSSHLVGHKRTHTGERPYICGICGEAFFTSSHLRNHVRRHTGEKPYVCQYCGDSFGQSVELRVHVRHHTGEKPFNCRECETAFVSARELKAHRKTHHLGSKPFKCEQCDRCFRTPTFLSKHQVRCKGPRPKRPKGRPRKYPRLDGEEPPWKKPKKRKNKRPAAPTDRVSRSTTRAIRNAQMKKEADDSNNEEGSHKLKDERKIESQEETPLVQEDTVAVNLGDIGSMKAEELVSEEQMSQLPMVPVVQVILDNLGQGGDSLDHTQQQTIMLQPTSSGMQTIQVPGGQNQQQIGVIDLSGQHLHQDDQQPVDTIPHGLTMVTSHLPITSNDHQHLPVISAHQVVSGHQQSPAVSAHHHSSQQQLPVVSAHQHQPLSVVAAHQQIPGITAHKQGLSSHQLPAVTAHQQAINSHQQLPVVSAHQQTLNAHQQVLVVSAHRQTAGNHQQVPVVSAHQQNTSTHQQTAVTAHQTVPVLAAHQQGLVVSAHQVPVASTSKEEGIDTSSQVIYGSGQPYVVDLSSPALTTQVPLVNQAVTSPQFTRP
uniref:C2H2-type domain-containing protein n=1 Tax=Scylla olivacea TaxID=85551 RepID=A0A0P4WIF1_SCYOL